MTLKLMKEVIWRLTEIITLLAVGLLFTIYILKPIYERFGIEFLGNVWVNWFGISYLLFVLYTIIAGVFVSKKSMFKQRLSSSMFWLLFIGSSYIVFIPFIKGENPF